MKLTKNEQVIHDQFSFCGKNAKEWMNKCVLLLPKVYKCEIWRKKGFSDIYDYARQVAGMSPYKVRESLRVLKKVEDKPALKNVISKKGLWAVKPVANIVTEATDKFWADKAIEMSQQTLKTYVHDFKIEQLGGAPGIPCKNSFKKPNDKKQITMKLDEGLVTELFKMKSNRDWNTLIGELVAAKKRELDREKQELEQTKPDKIKNRSHSIPAAIKHYVEQRSKDQCEHPNCNRKAEEFHHTIPYALNKEHNPDHIRHLCQAHHDLSHYGLVENQNNDPEKWQTKTQTDWYDINNIVNAKVQEYRKSILNHKEPG